MIWFQIFAALVLFCCWAACFISRAPKQEPKLPTLSPLTPPPYFHQGDGVRLKRENPYKGCLRAGQVITVLEVFRGDGWSKVKLQALNGTTGIFDARYFERYDGSATPPGISLAIGKSKAARKRMRVDRVRASMEAAAEYEEALAAQEMMK